MKRSISVFVNQHPWISFGLTLIILFGFQWFNILFGLDLYDTGFHLVAYENIFNAPHSVSYNFMYYLTNIVGGCLMKWFPGLGIIGFRIVGALLVMFTISIIFASLKREIPVIHLVLGSVLVVVGYVRLPYAFNNGILSCCLYAMAIILLYKGLVKENWRLLLLSGIIVGLNIFTRIPNVLAVGLVVIVFLHKKYYNKKDVFDWKNSCSFLIGVCLGVIMTLLLMHHLGHEEIFIRSLKVVFTMAGGEGTHSLLWMMKIHFAFYLSAVIPLLILYALFHIEDRIKNQASVYFTIVFYVIAMPSLFLYIYETSYVYTVLWGMCAVGCFLCAMRHKDQLGLLSIFALFMLFVEIYGSDYGVNHGGLPALLAAPVASSQLLNKRRLIFVLTFVLAVCWQIIRKGNFQDVGPLSQKTEQVNCIEANHILTTAQKANAINSTLEGIRPYVHFGDTLMCFPLAPMMNYLTHTRPTGGMSWIGENGTFSNPIEGLPKVLFNKTNFSGESWTEVYSLDSRYAFDIKGFITMHQYRKVYENDCFILYVP